MKQPQANNRSEYFFMTSVPGHTCITLWLLWCWRFLEVSGGLWFSNVRHSRVYHQLHWVLGVCFLGRRSPASGLCYLWPRFRWCLHTCYFSPSAFFDFLDTSAFVSANVLNCGYNSWGMMIFKNHSNIYMVNHYRICYVKIMGENIAVKLYVPH